MSTSEPIVLVTGASRGAGRGIAIAMGAHGATVYVTGRTTQAGEHPLPGTIHDTASAITAAGGTGIAVGCDHSDDEQVAALFERIRCERGRLDILINNAAAISDELTTPGAFWQKSLGLAALIDVGIRSSYVSSWHAAQMMTEQNSGLIAFTSASGAAHYSLGPAYGAHKVAMDKMAFDMAADFRHAGSAVNVLSVWMGALLTERLKSVIESDRDRYGHLEGRCESPEFTGHVIWALFQDPELASMNGRTLNIAALARRYALTDIDGRVPPTSEELHGINPIEFHDLEIR